MGQERMAVGVAGIINDWGASGQQKLAGSTPAALLSSCCPALHC